MSVLHLVLLQHQHKDQCGNQQTEQRQQPVEAAVLWVWFFHHLQPTRNF